MAAAAAQLCAARFAVRSSAPRTRRVPPSSVPSVNCTSSSAAVQRAASASVLAAVARSRCCFFAYRRADLCEILVPSGGQTVGAVLTALSTGAVSLRDAPRIVRKEACAGLAAGLLLGAALGPAVHYLGTPPPSWLVQRTARR